MKLEAPEFALEDTVKRSCCEEQLAGIDGDPNCGPCSITKPFCCSVTVNEEFRPATINPPGGNTRLVYDISELASFVETCTQTVTIGQGCPDVNITLYMVRVRGCLKYLASAEYLYSGTGKVCGGVFDPCTCLPNLNHQDKRYVVCCHDCASVNQILKVFPDEASARAFSDTFNNALTCGNVATPTLPNVSATMCVREQACGANLSNPTGCPSPCTNCPTCTTSGNANITFCGVFTFNI